MHSPLPAGAVVKGAWSLLFGPGQARRRVTRWLQSEFEVEDPLLTDSGTSALALAMKASLSGSRTSIMLPAYGCYDLVTAALAAGVPVRWYDVDPATLAPNRASLESAVTDDVAAIVIVHYFGVPVDLRPARSLAERWGTLIIEDAAQGIGGRMDERPLGAFGDLAVLSFGRGKGLTSGGGGALLANTPAGRTALTPSRRRLEPPGGATRPLVASFAQWLLARPATYAIPSALPFLRLGDTVFREPEPAREMNRVALRILSETVEHVWPEADVRRRNAARLAARAGRAATVPAGGIGQPGYLRLPVMLPSDRRHKAGEPGARTLGIMRGYPRVLTSLPGPTATSQSFPGSEELVGGLITLPVHSRLDERDLRALERWIDEV